MVLRTIIRRGDVALSELDERRIERRLRALERRLINRPEPEAVLALKAESAQRRVRADLRVQLGPLGMHLISHQDAETVDRAVRLAVEDVERQLERRRAQQAGESTFGVPSRRLPAERRPNPPPPRTASGPEQPDGGP